MTVKLLPDIAVKKPLLTIIIVCLAIRLICILVYRHITIFPDSEGYIGLAELLSNGSLDGYTGERSPGYPLLIAVMGNNLALIAALQMVLGIATALLFFKTVLRLNFPVKCALTVTLLLTTLLHVVFYETAILTESFTLFFVTLIFYMLFGGFYERGFPVKKMLLLGFALGYLTFIKPFYIFLPFIIYGLYVLKFFSLRTIINKRIVILIFPLIAFLGWSYVNKINTGYFVSTTYYGINIAQNCVYFAEKAPAEYKQISDIYVKHREEAIATNKDVAMTIWFAYDELTEKTGLSFTELSYELAQFSKAAIAANPADYLKQVALVSWRDFWKVDMYWNYGDFKIAPARKILLALWYVQCHMLLAVKILFVLLLPYHIFIFIRRRKVSPVFIISIIVLSTSILQAMATYGTNSRFSYPFEFFMVVAVLLTFEKKLRITKSS